MKCVICNKPTARHRHEDVVVDECEDGHGVWLDAHELADIVLRTDEPRSSVEKDAALAAAGPVVNDKIAETRRNCPACSKTMQKKIYGFGSGVVIDVCPLHGTWLDAGELQRIEAWDEARRDLREARACSVGSDIAELRRSQFSEDRVDSAGSTLGRLKQSLARR